MKVGDFVKMRDWTLSNPWDYIGIVVENDSGMVRVHWNNRYTWVGTCQLEVVNESR